MFFTFVDNLSDEGRALRRSGLYRSLDGEDYMRNVTNRGVSPRTSHDRIVERKVLSLDG